MKKNMVWFCFLVFCWAFQAGLAKMVTENDMKCKNGHQKWSLEVLVLAHAMISCVWSKCHFTIMFFAWWAQTVVEALLKTDVITTLYQERIGLAANCIYLTNFDFQDTPIFSSCCIMKSLLCRSMDWLPTPLIIPSGTDAYSLGVNHFFPTQDSLTGRVSKSSHLWRHRDHVLQVHSRLWGLISWQSPPGES